MKNNKNVALLVIDFQNDFVHKNGTLFVPGAVEDGQRLSKWILDNKKEIDFIGLTMDSHQPNSIHLPPFWQDKDGNFPSPFTIITSKDVEDGKWTPRFAPTAALKYLKDLEADGQYPNCIWPMHTIIGSWGQNIEENLLQAVLAWTQLGNFYQTVVKGVNPYTENFGIFEANIPIQNRPETQLNLNLIKTLEEYKTIYIAGEAKSHCVGYSIKQLLKYAPNLVKKIIFLEDCTSVVPGFEHAADLIYDDAKKAGVRFSTTAKEKITSHSVITA